MAGIEGGAAKAFAPTPRTRVKRKFDRARYDRETVHAILDAGLMCHVGYVIDGQPYVTPTAYWRQGDNVYWHGSSASQMLRQLCSGVPVCFTVALFDGLVLARSGFHSSINYRSVMAFGHAQAIEGVDAKLAALELLIERLTPGRWAELRPPTRQELKGTTVMTLKLEEVVAKVRAGGPVDEEEDYKHPVWAGVVPFATAPQLAIADSRLAPGVPLPSYLSNISIG
jgi:hypothetical protein